MVSFIHRGDRTMRTLSLSLALLVGCSGPQFVEAEAEWLNEPCSVADDCLLIFTGDLCDEGCPNTAIHEQFKPDAAAALRDARARCFPPPASTGDGACLENIAACVDGACETVLFEDR
jgi:hypothetical protein